MPVCMTYLMYLLYGVHRFQRWILTTNPLEGTRVHAGSHPSGPYQRHQCIQVSAIPRYDVIKIKLGFLLS